jgi:hypothetical protein
MDALEEITFKLLDGYGDAAAGEWTEEGINTFHLRRRLTVDEAELVGPVVDVRRTEEGARRVGAMLPWIIKAGCEDLAYQELNAQ